MNTNLIAKLTALSLTVGGLSVVSYQYVSKNDTIKKGINQLVTSGKYWKKYAETKEGELATKEGELATKQQELNTLKASIEEIADSLGLDKDSSIEDIINELQGGSIDSYNSMVSNIANMFGITLTEEDMGEDGKYKTDKLTNYVKDLEDEIDSIETTLGNFTLYEFNDSVSEMKESEMTLTNKIQYLINQITLANEDNTEIVAYLETAVSQVPMKEEHSNMLQEYNSLETSIRSELTSLGVSTGDITKVLNGEYSLYLNDGSLYLNETELVSDTVNEDLITKVSRYKELKVTLTELGVI